MSSDRDDTETRRKALAELEEIIGPGQSLDELVAEFLEVLESSDTVGDPDLSSVLEMLQEAVGDGGLNAEEIRRFLEGGGAESE